VTVAGHVTVVNLKTVAGHVTVTCHVTVVTLKTVAGHVTVAGRVTVVTLKTVTGHDGHWSRDRHDRRPYKPPQSFQPLRSLPLLRPCSG
jgi:hypothetical protein